MKELTDDFIPDVFLFREEQLSKIKETFEHFNKNRYSIINLIILGTTGAGKSGVVRKVIRDMKNCLYVSAADLNTSHKIFKAISGKNFHSSSDALVSSITTFKKEPKILVIDEVGKIKDKEEFCNSLNAFFREVQVPIILITNRWTFIQEMPDDARLTLFFERVEFTRYNALQLKEILKHRIGLIKDRIDMEIKDGDLNSICARVVKDYFSSVRVGLKILDRCITSNNFSDEFIEKIIENLKEIEWEIHINKMPLTEKEFLGYLLDLNLDEIPIIYLYEIPFFKDFGTSRISQICTSLIDYGIVQADWEHLGRHGGKFRKMKIEPQYRGKLLKLLRPWEDIENE